MSKIVNSKISFDMSVVRGNDVFIMRVYRLDNIKDFVCVETSNYNKLHKKYVNIEIMSMSDFETISHNLNNLINYILPKES